MLTACHLWFLVLHASTHLRVPVGRICLLLSIMGSGFFTGVWDLDDTGAAFWPLCSVSDRQGLWLKELRVKNMFKVKNTSASGIYSMVGKCLLFKRWCLANLRPVFMLSSAVLMSLVLSFVLCFHSTFSVLPLCVVQPKTRPQSANQPKHRSPPWRSNIKSL